MRLVNLIFSRIFNEIDRPTEKLQEIRDSYRLLNVEIYGEEIASILNDW